MARSDSSDSRSRHKKNKRKPSRSSSSSKQKRKDKGAKRYHRQVQLPYNPMNRYETRQNRQRNNKERQPYRPKQKQMPAKIQIVLSKTESDIRYHFRFRDLAISFKSVDQACSRLKRQISEFIGPVEFLQKTQNKRGLFTLSLGFKYDQDAQRYYSNVKQGMSLQIKLTQQSIKLDPQPTEVFKHFLKYLPDFRNNKNQKKNQNDRFQPEQRAQRITKKQRSHQHYHSNGRPQKNRRSESSSNQRKVNKRHQSRKSSSFSSSQRQNRSRAYYKNQSNQSKMHQNQNQKKIMVFGLSTSIKSAQISEFLKNSPEGPFHSKSFVWKRMANSICQYLELIMESSKAQKFLSMSQKVDIKGNPFIAIRSQGQDQNHILNQLKQFEINIQFPYQVSPYNVLKGIKNCGRVIQIVSNNKLSQKNTSDSYCVAFNNKQIAMQLKTMGKTSAGVGILELDRGQLVYRPTNKSEIFKNSQS